MKRQQLIIIISIITISLFAISKLLPYFNNPFSRIFKPKYSRVDISTLSPLNREDLYSITHDKAWRLKELNTTYKVVNPITGGEPKLWLSDKRVISFDLGCNITFIMTDIGTELEWNKYFLAENGQIKLISNHVGSRSALCAKEIGELETESFAPAVGEKGQFYLQNENLILHFTDRSTFFIFH